MSKYIEININCEKWGVYKLVRPVPEKENPYGSLLKYYDTYIWEMVSIIDSPVLENAINGIYMPLIRSLKASPRFMCRKMTNDFFCDYYKDKSCSLRNNSCKPCLKTPVCYYHSGYDDISDIVDFIRNDSYMVVILNETNDKKLRV